MRQLTRAEKKQLEGKIDKFQKRQQTLREMNPDLPKTLEAALAETGVVRKFGLNYFWKYGMLAIVLCLLAFNVFQLLRWRGSNDYINVNLVVALMLLFNHIAFHFTKAGWTSRVMKIASGIWAVLGLVYIFWVFR